MCMARRFTSCEEERAKALPVRSTKDQPLIFNFEPITERKPKVSTKDQPLIFNFEPITERKPKVSTKDQPLIFNFEPITERKPKVAGKKRRRRVLYPDHPVRKLPAQTDVAKRLLLAFLSIVILQVYWATEDEPSLDPVEVNMPSDLPWSGTDLLPTVPTGTDAHCVLELVEEDLWRSLGALRCPVKDSQLGG